MRAIEAIVFLAALSLAGGIVIAQLRAARRRRRATEAPWQVREHPADWGLGIYCERGSERWLIGVVRSDDPDSPSTLIRLHQKALEAQAELNAGVPWRLVRTRV